MISLILREKMSEPPPAEEVQVQVTVLLGVKVSEPPPEVPELPEFPPQAVRARSIRAARVKAISFFIVRSPSFQLYFHWDWKSNKFGALYRGFIFRAQLFADGLYRRGQNQHQEHRQKHQL